MVSALDVARQAGVSRSAVSRTFTPGASVSTSTRAKVTAAAEALGYRPNVLARSLITGRSRIVGLVAAYLDNLFYPVVLERLCRALQAQGYHVMIFIAGDRYGESGAEVQTVLDEILDYQVDAIVLASVSISSTLARRCAEAGVPVVLFNRTQDDPALSAIASDNVAGGRALGRFLLSGGHERIAYIAGWEGASTQRDREAGFRAALAVGGRGLFARDVGDYGFERAQAAARRMFGRPTLPDAVFVANDHMAFAVMDVIRFELGLRIPADVSVVSYDNVPQAAWPSYDLTSVAQPTDGMVQALTDALVHRIEQADSIPRQVILPGRLVVRGSARLPRSAADD